MISSNWLAQGFLYLLSLTLFFLGINMISIWVIMEINLLLFLFFIYSLDKVSSSLKFFKMSLFYFLTQSVGSLIFLLFLVFNELDFSCWLNQFLLFLSMGVKIGLYPFVFWMFEISSLLSSVSFFFLLTLQKIPYFFIFFSFSLYTEFLCFLSFIMGSMLVYFSRNLDWLLISSSVSSVIWIYFLFAESESSFFLFFLVYSFCLIPLLFVGGVWRGFKLGSSSSFMMVSILFMFFLGLPPFSLFLFKVDVVNFLFQLESKIFIFFFLFFSIFTLAGYFKTFFKDLVLTKELYNFKSASSIFNFFNAFFLLFISILLFF